VTNISTANRMKQSTFCYLQNWRS